MILSNWCGRKHSLMLVGAATAVLLTVAGCENDSAEIRRMQSDRQAKVQTQSDVDHLREASDLIARLDELDAQSAADQVNYHLNAWRQTDAGASTWEPSKLLNTLPAILPEAKARELVTQERFQESDLEYFRLNYLLRQVAEWSQQKQVLDPLIPWMVAAEKEDLTKTGQRDLELACLLFDWVVRNIQLEPSEPEGPLPPAPNLPAGLAFEGPGYRQTSFQTLWRSSGDWLQRADVFLQLCRHGGLDGCLLATPATDAAAPREWMTGVLIEGQLYLFAPQFGIPVPGPDEKGIATLQDARDDESVLRRLRVPGVFDYEHDRNSIQQSVALLVTTPEMLSDRMRRLEAALTGKNRMQLSMDADHLAEWLDDIPGIAGVRLWRIPLLSRQYQEALRKQVAQSVSLAQWYYVNFAFLEPGSNLSSARWKHLKGDFEGSRDILDDPGARLRYMELRHPEFELEDLQLDVDLQKKYGIRRGLGEEADVYARKIQAMQMILRQTKRAATFWIALLHVEDGRWGAAETWLSERVLADPDASRWHPAARYNLARTMEHVGNNSRAIELYKTGGDPQEHGNRIRARLVEYAANSAAADDSAQESVDEQDAADAGN